MKIHEFKESNAYFITIKGEPELLFCFIDYEERGEEKWHLVRDITDFKKGDDLGVVVTAGSKYRLYNSEFKSVELTLEEFLFCKMGHTPLDAIALRKIQLDFKELTEKMDIKNKPKLL